MSLNNRLEEVMPTDKALSQVSIDGTTYIRSEYFKDGQRVFFSPLDFALNGPDEGSIVTRKTDDGCEYTVKVLRKHYERGEEAPCMVEVEVTNMYHNIILVAKQILWVIVRATKTTIDKFKLKPELGVRGHSFALVPDFFIQNNVRMNHMSPVNDVTIAFSSVAGIPKEYLVLEDLL